MSKAAATALLLVSILLTLPPEVRAQGCVNPTFGSSTEVDVGNGPQSVVIADFNRDGLGDIASANSADGTVSVSLNSALGSFGTSTSFSVGITPVWIAAGDLNGDGLIDLAVANSGSNNVSILPGNGAGSFGSAQNFNVGTQPVAVALVDLNNDRRLDLAVANFNSSNVSVLLATSAGSFAAAVNFATSTGPASIATGDFNGDGKVDLAVSNETTGNISLLYGNGAGSLTTPATTLSGGGGGSIAAGDFNNDGLPDLVTTDISSPSVTVFLRTGTTSFGTPTAYASGGGTRSVAVSDFNADGPLDLAVPNSDGVAVLAGTGTGSFGSAAQTFTGGVNPYGVAIGDVDADARNDVALANNDSADVSVVPNTCAVWPTITSLTPARGPASGGTSITVTGSGFSSIDTTTFLFGGNSSMGSCSSPSRCTVLAPIGSPGPVRVTASVNGVSSTDTPADDFIYAAAQPCANTSFVRRSASTSAATAVVAYDFNNDGIKDLAVGESGSPAVSVLYGNFNGTYGNSVSHAVAAAPTSLALGDFNGDSVIDLAVANSTVTLLFGVAGTFGGTTNISTGTSPKSVAVGDFNSDGFADIAAAGDFGVSIILGKSSGPYAVSRTLAAGALSHSVAVADFNGDGRSDLAVANAGSRDVSVLLGDGAGDFGKATHYSLVVNPADVTPHFVAVGDVNHDGKRDLAITLQPPGSGYTLALLLGDGLGSFGTLKRLSFSGSTGASAVVIADIDGDGQNEIAIANQNAGTLAIIRISNYTASQIGWTTFAQLPFNNPTHVAISDFSSDGRLDLAVTDATGATALASVCAPVTVTAVDPAQGPTTGGTKVTITGTGFNPFSYVYFGSTLRVASCASTTSCTVIAPAGSGTVSVRVSNGILTSAPTTASNFTYLALPTCQSTRFDKTTLPAGVSPRAIAAGDFNGDGRADLVVANRGTNMASETISVRLGTGTGTFGAQTLFASAGGPRHVVAADFNEDGRSDVAAANQTTNDLSIFIATSVGGFGSATKVVVATGPSFIAAGDFDSDGHTDLAVAHDGSNDIMILLGTGTGAFVERTRFSVPSGVHAHTLAVADFNGDFDADLVVGHEFNSSVSVMLGDGSGLFPTILEHTTTAIRSGTTVAVGDFNDDGYQDVAVSHPAQSFIGVLLGLGNGNLGARTEYTLPYGGGRRSILVGDYNADGFVDLILGSANFLSVMRGNGTGTFSGPEDYAFAFTTGLSVSIVAGDFDRDGLTDFASSNDNSYDMTILLNVCGKRTVIETVTPDSGDWTGGTTVTITGTQLANPTAVTFGGAEATVTASGATSITAVTPPGTPGLVFVSVTTAMGQDAIHGFTYSKANTSTSVSSNDNPSEAGATVTLQALVTSTYANNKSGTITFMSGTTAMGTVAVDEDGIASLTSPPLAAGTYSITAIYSGDSLYNGSTSPVLTQTVQPPFGPPPSFVAQATSASTVGLSWTAVYGAGAYEIERSSMNGAFAWIKTVSGNSTTDTGLSPDTTYLYRVRATQMGPPSGYTAVDPATTIIFTDHPLPVSQQIKAVHITQLRTAVNAMRAAAGLLPVSFTDATLAAGATLIRRLHVTELQDGLVQARSTIGLPSMGTIEPITAGITKVKGSHIAQLRSGTQ